MGLIAFLIALFNCFWNFDIHESIITIPNYPFNQHIGDFKL